MNAVFKLLNPDNTVTVNRPLAHALGTNEAIIYSALIGKKAYYEQSNKLDEDGWFYSTIKDLQESTCLTRSQQDSAIKNLTDAKLIECKRKGTPARRHFWVNTDEEIITKLLKKGEEIMRSLNPLVNSTTQKSDKQDCRKSANKFAENPQTCLREIDKPTYNPNKKSKEKNPNQSIPADAGDGIDRIDNSDKACSVNEREEYLSLIHENIDYDYLTDKSEKEKIDELVEIMLDVICSTKDTVRVNGEDVPREVVKSRFLKLDSSHVDYVLTALGKNTTDVRNIRAYLITALYNAPATIDSYYTAWVNHDMYGGS